MREKILENYKEKILEKFGFLDIAYNSYITDEADKKLRSTPIEEIFVVDFEEYGAKNQRSIGFSAMLDDSDNKIILGEPGCGKTTFLKYIISKKIDEEIVTVYWEWENLYEQIDREIDFNTIVFNYFADFFQDKFNNKAVKSFIEKNRFIFLIDRFDRFVSKDRLSKVLKILQNYKENKKKSKDNYFVIASRIANYPKEYFNLFSGIGFRHYKISPLSDSLIYHNIYKFITYVSGDKVKSPDKVTFLKRYIKSQPGIKKLAENPFFLNFIVLIYLYDGDLPPSRLRLYEKCIEMLIYEWKNSYKDIKEFDKLYLNDKILRRILIETAYEYFNKFLSGKVKEFGTLSRTELEDTLKGIYTNLIPHKISVNKSKKAVSCLFKYFENKNGIIVEKSNGQFGFSHHTLFEYLAAQRLKQKYSNYEKSLNYCIEVLKEKRFRNIEETIVLFIELTGPKFIDIITKRLLSLYKQQKNKKVLILLTKLLKYSEDFNVDDAGEILNLLAIYKLNHPEDHKISDLVNDIFGFSKRLRDEFIYLVEKFSKEKEKWMKFTEETAYWIGKITSDMKIDLDFVAKESQREGKSALSPGLQIKVNKIMEQLELLETITARYRELVSENHVMFREYDPDLIMKEIVEKFKKGYPNNVNKLER